MNRIAILTAFVELADSGAFAAAAKRLGVTAAVLSKHPQFLDPRLSVRLLNRTTRKIRLTQSGARYYQHGAQVLSNFAEMESPAASLKTTRPRTVRINTDISLGRVLGPMIAEYVARHHRISCELIITERKVDFIEERFDLAVRVDDVPTCNSLTARLIGIRRSVLGASPVYLGRFGAPNHPNDLSGHNCLVLTHSPADRHWCFISADNEHVVEIDGNLSSNCIETVRSATIAGYGISFLPLDVVAGDFSTGRLRRVLPDYSPKDARVYAIYPAGGYVSLNLGTLLDFLDEQLRRLGVDRFRQDEIERLSACTFHPDQQG